MSLLCSMLDQYSRQNTINGLAWCDNWPIIWLRRLLMVEAIIVCSRNWSNYRRVWFAGARGERRDNDSGAHTGNIFSSQETGIIPVEWQLRMENPHRTKDQGSQSGMSTTTTSRRGSGQGGNGSEKGSRRQRDWPGWWRSRRWWGSGARRRRRRSWRWPPTLATTRSTVWPIVGKSWSPMSDWLESSCRWYCWAMFESFTDDNILTS